LSGSRAIVLTLSVRDADVVRQQLVQMGEQGERALQRLDAAAQRSASGAGMPALARSTQEATANTGRFSQAVGSAGYQIQDFAVQVQMGQNAMSAFGAQASQFLGVFGTGGAIAGAILTVGILAAQLLLGRDNAAELAKVADEGFRNTGRAAEDLARIIERVNDLYLTQGERALRAGEATRVQLLEQLRLQQSNAVQMQEGSAMELPGARRDMEREERRLATIQARNERLRRAGSNVPLDEEDEARGRVFAARARIQGLEADLNRQSSRIGQIAEAVRRAENAGNDQGFGQYGPPAPEATRPERPGRAPRDTLADDIDRLIRDTETPLARYERRIAEIQTLAQRAREAGNPIPAENIERAIDAAVADFGRMQRGIEQVGQETQRTSQFANQLGFSFSSAFEDAIIKGKSFSEVLKGLEQDIARIIIRSAVTQPLGNALAGGVQSVMGAFSFSSLFGSSGGVTPVPATGGISQNPFGFANGGIMTPGGPLPLNRYAMGGIANSPQLALFGEGRTPEAYVPLPDGRRIPVAMQGGGGMTFAPTYNIDARGADASIVPRLRAEMVAIARASNAELLDSIQRGGSAARIVGRRA
jgi:hypothetical protein